MDYAQAVSVKEEVIVWEINSVSSSDMVGVIVLTQNLNRFWIIYTFLAKNFKTKGPTFDLKQVWHSLKRTTGFKITLWFWQHASFWLDSIQHQSPFKECPN